MKHGARFPLLNPFFAWADVARTIGEMLLASAQVIAHRTTRMATAGPMPNARDRREFSRMGEEKVEAGFESVQAIASRAAAMNLALGSRVFGDLMAGATAMMSLATSRNATQLTARQAQLVKLMTRSTHTAADVAHSTADLASRGLRPIHARATANARRLGKR